MDSLFFLKEGYMSKMTAQRTVDRWYFRAPPTRNQRATIHTGMKEIIKHDHRRPRRRSRLTMHVRSANWTTTMATPELCCWVCFGRRRLSRTPPSPASRLARAWSTSRQPRLGQGVHVRVSILFSVILARFTLKNDRSIAHKWIVDSDKV
jgi:hypothetical protein